MKKHSENLLTVTRGRLARDLVATRPDARLGVDGARGLGPTATRANLASVAAADGAVAEVRPARPGTWSETQTKS